ncbi:MAG: DUF2207 family protein [Ilumatobacteraceae bacterium]
MLGKLGWWRHLVMAFVIVGISVLALLGVIGRKSLPERFDAKVVTVQPSGADGVRIREVVDEDFGTKDRHGYQRIIPTDFGSPTDVEASSPDANATVDITPLGSADRIRLGDPNTTFTGQHRYILSYTLPNAELSSGRLNLDIIGDPLNPEPFETGRFEVDLIGLQLDNPTCDVGAAGTTGGCTLARVGDVYRTVISPLKAGQGITIGGTITGQLPVTQPIDPPVPARRSDDRVVLALAALVLGTIAAGAVYIVSRRAGRNEVFAGGAADAAYGSLPQPSQGAPPVAVRLVADSKMEELATIEFVPPKGIDPWQGAVLLNERIDRGTTAAWISGVVAKDGLTLSKDGDEVTIGRGPKYDQLDTDSQQLITQLLDFKDELTLGTYNANFGKAWGAIQTLERDGIATSGWWKRFPPSSVGGGGSASSLAVVVVIAFFFFGAGSLVTALVGLFHNKVSALLFALVVPAIAAYFLYKAMLSARSATGSALALRAESFRKFLEASEGQHVDWAWKQGLLREYSAWAVALGAADAWGRALEHSNVPAPEMNVANPLWLYSMGPSFDSTRSAPAPSGGSGGSSFGGFSGGVGGGGGGGSSGSW